MRENKWFQDSGKKDLAGSVKMNKLQFCKRIKYFIKDEAGTSKEYSSIPEKFELTKSESKKFKKAGKDEAKHRKFFIKIYDKYCRRK